MATEFDNASVAAKNAITAAENDLLDATTLRLSQQLPATIQLPVQVGPAGDVDGYQYPRKNGAVFNFQ